MEDVAAGLEELLGGESSVEESPVGFEDYIPKEKVSSALLQDDPELSGEEVAGEKEIEVDVRSLDTKGEPQYEKLIRMMHDGKTLYRVKNASDILFKCDWDMTLMPHDMRIGFNKFLESKYLQYGIRHLKGTDPVITNIYDKSRTTNFIHNYMIENQVPTIVPLVVGKDVVMTSQIVIPSGEFAIFTEKQIESLERFEKVRRAYDSPTKKPGEAQTMSDWAGFLIFTELTKDTVRNIQRSYVLEEDVYNGGLTIDSKALESKPFGRSGTSEIIRATE